MPLPLLLLPHLGAADARGCQVLQLPLGELPTIWHARVAALLVGWRRQQEALQLIEVQTGPAASIVVGRVQLQHSSPRLGGSTAPTSDKTRRQEGGGRRFSGGRDVIAALIDSISSLTITHSIKQCAATRIARQRAHAATMDSVRPVPITTRSNSDGSIASISPGFSGCTQHTGKLLLGCRHRATLRGAAALLTSFII